MATNDDIFARIDQRKKLNAQREADAIGIAEQLPGVREAEANVAEERRGLMMDAVVGAVRAVPSTFAETFDLIASLDEAMMKNVIAASHAVGLGDVRLGDDPRTEEVESFLNGFSLNKEESEQFPLTSIARPSATGLDLITEGFPEPERLTGQLIEPITKFVLGFIGGKKLLQGAGALQGTTRGAVFANTVAASALSDAAVFDGHEQRASDMIQATAAPGGFPDISNAMTEYLASDVEDTELEGRLKNVLEGAGLGVLVDSVIVGLRGIRAHRMNVAIKDAVASVEDVKVPLSTDAPKLTPIDNPAFEFDNLRVDSEGRSTLILATRETRVGAEKGLGPNEAGKLELMARGDQLQVINARVEAASQGKGNGVKLYNEAARLADEQGKTLVSDTSVSESAARVWDSMAKKGDDIVDQRITNPDNVDLVEGQYITRNNTPVFERKPKPVAEPAPKLTPEELVVARRAETKAQVSNTMTITAEQRIAFSAAIEAGDEGAAAAVLKDFNENNIDWTKIEDAEDIKSVLLTTERVFADLVDNAKGGVQSNAKTKMLADLVDANPTEVRNLFRDTRSEGGIAARFYAAQRTMLASAGEVRRTALESLKNPGSAKHEAAALRAIQVHVAIQAEVKGAQTEIARALQGMGMIKEAAADNYKAFDDIRKQFAGEGKGKTAWEAKMDELLATQDLSSLNRMTQRTAAQKFRDIFVEYTINSMLSSPKTHIINFSSNVLNTFIYSADRLIGGSYRTLVHGDRQAFREARIDLHSKLTRLDEAWKLAKQAWRDGAPVTDKRQRLEFKSRTAISSSGTVRETAFSAADEAAPELGQKFIARKTEAVRNDAGAVMSVVDHTTMQRIINTIGRVVRVPGRALITGDEFFKAINRNAEVSVQAFRQADEEALLKNLEYGTDAYETFVKNRVIKLSDMTIKDAENIRIEGIAGRKARLVTFQESPRTSFGSKAESLVNSNVWFKLTFAPFFRTPMNILRQGIFDRTPLGYTMKHTRDLLADAHPRDVAEIQARLWTGVGAAVAFMGFTNNGTTNEDGTEKSGFEIIGKVPYGSSAKAANVQDYSIRLGDRWYQFNRLEPFGMWLGMVADMGTASKYANEGDEEWAFGVWQAAAASFQNNVTGKTFMTSLQDFQELGESMKTARSATVKRGVAQFAAGQFGKLIPGLFKGTAAALEGEDRTAPEAWTILDILAARSAIFNGDLRPQHDILGREIPKDGGLSILMNPFSISQTSDDPVDKEMFRLGFDTSKMQKSLAAGAVDLTAEEYSTLTGLVAKTGVLETLTALVTSDGWSELNPTLQKVLMKEIISESHANARMMFLGEPGIAEKMSQANINAAMMLVE